MGQPPETTLPGRPHRGRGSRSSADGVPSTPPPPPPPSPPPAPTSPRWQAAGARFRFRCKRPGRGGKMAAAVGVRGRCELPPCSGPGWLFSFSALLSMAARGAFATTHWVVTEDGKIQQQVVARTSLGARARPRLRGIPRPTPACLAPRGPAPSLPSHGPCAPARVTPASPPPHLCVPWPLPRTPAGFRASTLGAARRVGESPGDGGSGPGDIFSGSRNPRFVIYPCLWVPSGPRVTSSPLGSRKQVAAPGCERVPGW